MGMSAQGGGGRRGGPMSDINVTPMVDIMLVLLIIFMVTAPLINPGVEVNLPNVDAKALQKNDETPEVTVKPDGSIYVEKKAVTLDQLGAMMAAMKKANSKLSVIIKGDKTTDYGKMMAVMAKLQQSGVDQIGLQTEPR
ncbi:MAG: protein TolR [Magnetococcales bacterium]|nr:protein TolR [Magnetococcales bacterium]NGZ28778.1 protein TolR [Magnetococcales bacterium]